jgi:antirestriction protein ArdC
VPCYALTLGIDGQMQENHVALYIANWLKQFSRMTKRLILTASAKAQQALDFLTKAKQVNEALAA